MIFDTIIKFTQKPNPDEDLYSFDREQMIFTKNLHMDFKDDEIYFGGLGINLSIGRKHIGRFEASVK